MYQCPHTLCQGHWVLSWETLSVPFTFTCFGNLCCPYVIPLLTSVVGPGAHGRPTVTCLHMPSLPTNDKRSGQFTGSSLASVHHYTPFHRILQLCKLPRVEQEHYTSVLQTVSLSAFVCCSSIVHCLLRPPETSSCRLFTNSKSTARNEDNCVVSSWGIAHSSFDESLRSCRCR